MLKRKILVVDDEPDIVETLKFRLEAQGYEANGVSSGEEAIQKVKEADFDVVIADLKMPGIDGLGVLKAIKKIDAELPVIILTGHGTIETAVKTMREGAYDYILKPLQQEELKKAVSNALKMYRLVGEKRYLQQKLRASYNFGNIIGNSPKMEEIYRLIQKVAPTASTVMIYGETGTGKELLAHAIHFNSLRRERPFVAVNCSALPETLLESELFGYRKGAFTGAYTDKAGRFELADEGTIFLDEIGDMNPSLQMKILRVLQEREFERVGGTKTTKIDVRVIAATNRDVEKAIKEGTFREELYYRLNVVPIHLPPLRERMGDLSLLTEHFLQKYNQETGKKVQNISPEAMDSLMRYDWPGNIRELENVIERAVILSDGESIVPEDLSLNPSHIEPFMEAKDNLKEALGEYEREHIIRILAKTDKNKSRAAQALGVSLSSLYRKLEELGISCKKS